MSSNRIVKFLDGTELPKLPKYPTPMKVKEYFPNYIPARQSAHDKELLLQVASDYLETFKDFNSTLTPEMLVTFFNNTV